jgi:NAD+ dependent glucose-6-phosphate dehydrogenase
MSEGDMSRESSTKRTILLTGAAGRIGTAFFEHAKDRYRFRLADRRFETLPERAGADHEAIELDVADADGCQAACADIDTVIHLGADPSPEAEFYGSLLDNNIKGTYNIFQAAKDQGCQRVIFASSIHAVVGYPKEVQVHPKIEVRPNNMYGVSKVFGEAVASRFALAEGLSSIAIRIGAYEADWIREKPTPEAVSAFLSKRDMNHLLERCIETPDIDYAVVHGISNNRFKRLDISLTRELLDYQPQDDGFTYYDVIWTD